MTYRLLALDLDGTLLDESLQLDMVSARAVAELVKRGVHVVACTGRPFPSALPWTGRLGLHDPLVCYQGAEVRGLDGEVMLDHGVARELAAEVIGVCRQLDAEIHAYLDDRLIADQDRPELHLYANHSGMEIHFVPDLIAALGRTTPKLVSVADEATVKTRLGDFSERWRGRLNVATSLPRYLEMTSSHADKAAALGFLAGRLGVTAQEAVAVGDGRNDRSMLVWAGLGVAVEGAPEEVLAVSDRTVAPPGSGGLADLIGELWGRNGNRLPGVTRG